MISTTQTDGGKLQILCDKHMTCTNQKMMDIFHSIISIEML